jgi:hypothetical protein
MQSRSQDCISDPGTFALVKERQTGGDVEPACNATGNQRVKKYASAGPGEMFSTRLNTHGGFTSAAVVPPDMINSERVNIIITLSAAAVGGDWFCPPPSSFPACISCHYTRNCMKNHRYSSCLPEHVTQEGFSRAINKIFI